MERLETLLIANRGEIACRLIKTARQLGIRTIAVYSEVDSSSLHVRLADRAHLLQGEPRRAYLDGDQIIDIAKVERAQAIAPGYGLLSENAHFAACVQQAGLVFVGPSSANIESFGLKHTARKLAISAGVPVVPGSADLVIDEDDAVKTALHLGFPVMLKATAGGGGHGIVVCQNESDVRTNCAKVRSRGKALFKNSGLFVESFYPNSRHIEVQVFGNGKGDVISIGERECSIQRRRQKIIEECPSPFIAQWHPHLREKLTDCAVKLAASVCYSSVGTVEFLVDEQTGLFYFLEMNTRLQVEHGVTELCYDIDLVELTYRQADAQLLGKGGLDREALLGLQSKLREPRGSTIEVRIYAENPMKDFMPSAGVIQEVEWVELPGTRIDTWVSTGTKIGSHYDPLVAKIMQWSATRAEAIAKLDVVLSKSKLSGPGSNIDYLRSIIQSQAFQSGKTLTNFLDQFEYHASAIDVISGGSLTLIQDYPGRPSAGHGFGHGGPMDDIAFQAANILVGNSLTTEGLEITMHGPELRFTGDAIIAVCGPPASFTIDGESVPLWSRIRIRANQRLRIGEIRIGCRLFLAVYGGFPGIARWFGSKSTSPSMKLGGYQGRSLQAGDFLKLVNLAPALLESSPSLTVPVHFLPLYCHEWKVQVMPGPYETGYLSLGDIEMVYSHPWKVSHNAARNGIRLVGPAPDFARDNGGDGGAHPSNVVEYGYPIGGVNWTGSEPLVFSVDSPDFGGFICSMTVVRSDWWKLGQIRAGDTVRFHRVTLQRALESQRANQDFLRSLQDAVDTDSWLAMRSFSGALCEAVPDYPGSDVIKRLPKQARTPQTTYRAGGDSFVLVDYGTGTADLNHKCRAVSLKNAIAGHNFTPSSAKQAIIHVVSCGNSIMIHYDAAQLDQRDLIEQLVQLERTLGSSEMALVANRRFKLPIVFRHPKIDDCMERYRENQRATATYLPDTLQFIAETNGMSTTQLKQMVLSLEAVVVGVGFLMAVPQSLPVDPRHRLNCPKMNPSRTFTPAGTVAWGGKAIAIYTEDSPGGYMPIGLTIPGVDIFGSKAGFSANKPWMFEDMDVITFYEVSAEVFDQKVAAFQAGSYKFEQVASTFDMAAYNQMLEVVQSEAEALEERRQVAQEKMARQEEEMWHQWMNSKKASVMDESVVASFLRGPGSSAIVSPMDANLWKVHVQEGDILELNQTVITLEAMKMEIEVRTLPELVGAKVHRVLVEPGFTVASGQTLLLAASTKHESPSF